METKWRAPESDVVLLTCVRLMRNFADIPFASLMNEEEAAHNITRVTEALEKAHQKESFIFCRLADMTFPERGRLEEHCLISKELLKHASKAAVYLSKGSTISIMINEEDHVKVHGLLPGFQLERTADLAYSADEWLDKSGAYAYDDQFGFLTANPIAAGNGLCATLLMHLPTMRASGQIGRLAQEAAHLSLELKPWRADKEDAFGNLYCLSGIAKIGRTETDLLELLAETARKIIDCERGVRNKIYEQDPLVMEDRIERSLAMIRAAKLMSEREMMLRCSDLRLAATLGIFDISSETIDQILFDMRDASIECRSTDKLTERQRDILRAQALREAIDAALKQPPIE